MIGNDFTILYKHRMKGGQCYYLKILKKSSYIMVSMKKQHIVYLMFISMDEKCWNRGLCCIVVIKGKIEGKINK